MQQSDSFSDAAWTELHDMSADHAGLAISASLCFTRCEASIENIWSRVRDLAVECGWRLEQLSGAHTKRACADQFLARLLTHCWLVVSHKKTMFFRRIAELRSEVPPEGRRSHDLRPGRRGNGGQQAVSWYAVMDVKNMPTRRWHQCRGFLGLPQNHVIESRGLAAATGTALCQELAAAEVPYEVVPAVWV